ncbi:hypothetical protein [Deinococcus daejeonensis]|uniref:Uncharacterized protein n=1 Tax=Deinococcus daejeonensis TaxID=1007098 RepID=A0ABQ2IU19_9DEIO|nr:hypothetical protein [Deinococcus daejeonensis]GGN27445.1 hypothetical protein GCM10010842_00420 [Deinococcus daejeonensis]
MRKTRWLTALTAAAALTALDTPAQAADLRLSATSSLGLSCGVAGARAGLQEGRFGGFIEGAYCTSNVEGQSGKAALSGGLTFDVFDAGLISGYVLGGGGFQGSSSVLFAGVGARVGLDLVPVEGFIEAAYQRVSTPLVNVPGPRFAVGITYRINVGDLSQYAAPLAETSSTSGGATGTSGPAQCQLTPEADAASARATAVGAANEALDAAASSYSAGFSNFSYRVSTSGVSINGNSARVSGSVTISLTSRSTGERTTSTYSGTVSLVRDGCGWRATGYSRSGGEEG